VNEKLIICLNHNFGGTHKVVSFEGVTGPVIEEWFNALCSFYTDYKVLEINSGASAGAIIGALKLSGLAHRIPSFWRRYVLPEVRKSLGPNYVLAKLPWIAGYLARDIGLFRARNEIADILKAQLNHDLILAQPLLIFATVRRSKSPFVFYTGEVPEWLFGEIPHYQVTDKALLDQALNASSNTFKFKPIRILGMDFIDGMFAENPTVSRCLEHFALQVLKRQALMFMALVGPYNPRKKRNIYHKFGEQNYQDLDAMKDSNGLIRMPGADHIAEVFPHLGSPLPPGDLPSEMHEIRKLMKEVIKPLIREIEIYNWVQQHERLHVPMEQTKFNPWSHFYSQSVD
jgi:hypothetical protein